MSLPRHLQDNYYKQEIIKINNFLSNYQKNSYTYKEAKKFLYSQLNAKCWELVYIKNGIKPYISRNLPVSICKGIPDSCVYCHPWMIKSYINQKKEAFKNTYVRKYTIRYINGFKIIKMGGYMIKLNYTNKTRVASETVLSLYREGKDYIHKGSDEVIFDLSGSGILSKLERMTLIIGKMIKANTARRRETTGRAFTAPMKVIIFERDGYRCRICGRHRDFLNKEEHLEADHIKAWVDGGKTKLSNGQTLCSTCNKAKHHAKRLYEVKK